MNMYTHVHVGMFAFGKCIPRVVVCCSVLQCVAACCSGLQCVAVCGSVLHCVAVSFCICIPPSTLYAGDLYGVLVHSVVVCCSVLQRAAVCCRVL